MMSIFRVVRGVVVIIGLSALVMGINVVQMLSVVLLIFGRKAFMRFNNGCQSVFGYWNMKGGQWCGNRIIATGDIPTQEDALVMANHQGMLDIPVLWMWSSPMGTSGWMKWFVKDEFKYVPGPGWGVKFISALLVKRDWSKDADSIRSTFHKILECDLPFWVMIFPEGTRMKPSKFVSSRAYAKRKGLPVFERVLVPRPKGVWASIQGLRPKLQAIYDVSIAYDESVAPALGRYFCRGGFIIKIHVTRIPVESLPTIEREFNQWVTQRFVVKDEWIQKESPQPKV